MTSRTADQDRLRVQCQGFQHVGAAANTAAAELPHLANMLLTGQGRIKLVDFGLVRQDPRNLLGTVEFMSPEQSLDPSTVGSQTDVYGLGASLFWLLTGEPPFPKAKSIGEAMRMLQNTPPRRLGELRPDIRRPLEAVVERMLDRDPIRRPVLPAYRNQGVATLLRRADKRSSTIGGSPLSAKTDLTPIAQI